MAALVHRRADKAIAVGKWRVDTEIARARITFEAESCITYNPESIGITFPETADKCGPGVIS
jgi:hypothetical protein